METLLLKNAMVNLNFSFNFIDNKIEINICEEINEKICT